MQAKRIFEIIFNILRITLVAAAVTSIFYASWQNLSISILALVLTFLPTWIEKKYSISIPLDIELVIILFIYASLFLGEINKFYIKFWWWDIALHTFSAVAFALIGFIILFILFKTNKITSKPIWIALFSFCFSVAIGSIWEIFEFSVDNFFGTNMQKSGLVDTMWDMISNCIGAASASLIGFAYMKGSQRSYLTKVIGYFIKNNSNIKL